jgi:ribosomal protein S18 acetylase RimI-like enzyme
MTMISIRPASIDDAPRIAYIHVRAWQESYHGILDQDFLDNISYADRLALRRKILSTPGEKTLYLVALAEDEIVGFCDVGPGRDQTLSSKGEVYAIYLLKSYKYKGIGNQLFTMARQHLLEHGLVPFVAWVLEENVPACQFYIHQGGQKGGEEVVKIGSHDHKEIAYVFEF